MPEKSVTIDSEAKPLQRSESVKQYYTGKDNMVHLYRPLIDRTYELPYRWYYLVFKPFNDSYDVNKYSICLSKVSDYFRKSKHVDQLISSREILATKIHVNLLCASNEDLYKLFHGKNVTIRGLKYKINVEYVDTYDHRYNILQYMFKEADVRDYQLYIDHQSFQKTVLNKVCLAPSESVGACNSSDDPDEPVRLTVRLV